MFLVSISVKARENVCDPEYLLTTKKKFAQTYTHKRTQSFNVKQYSISGHHHWGIHSLSCSCFRVHFNSFMFSK